MRIIEQTMKRTRTTKRTFRFETENPNEDSLGVVYIKQTAFGGKQPESIRLFVEAD